MIVLVTGGSSGIGLATVRRLAAAGHRVFAASRRPDRARYPDGVTPLQLDVASPRACEEAVDLVVGQAGGIDAVVNNAGLGTIGPLEEFDEDEAHRMFDVNVFGPMRLARLALPAMRENGAGRIVNVTSMNDVVPAPFGGWYSASKAALASASSVLGAELHAFGIRVTVVAPGLYLTEMAQALLTAEVAQGSPYQAAMDGVRAQNAERLETAGDPDEVARAIEDCLSSEEPPARVVVGADATNLERLVHGSTPDEFARLLRDFVAELSASN